MDRREFLQKTGAGTIGAASTLVVPGKVAASDRIGVGLIGSGGMGRLNLTDFLKQPEVQAVAVCDVYQSNIDKALALTEGKAKIYKDYRRLLENKDVEVVIIATPDH